MSLRQVSVPVAAGSSEYFPFNGNYLRAKTAPYDVIVENVDEGGRDVFALSQGEDALFDKEYKRLKITNTGGADAVFIFTIGKNAKVSSAIVSGSVTISGTPTVLIGGTANVLNTNPVTNPALVSDKGTTYGASYRSTVALAANTPETVFSAASNVNGAILHSAQFTCYNASYVQSAFLAKSSAPANVTDGDGILSGDSVAFIASNYFQSGSLKNAIRIPAGKGVYFISNNTEATNYSNRSALYTLL